LTVNFFTSFSFSCLINPFDHITGGVLGQSPTLDVSFCGQSGVKWAVCTSTLCTYKFGSPSFAPTVTGASTRLYMCINQPETAGQCPVGYTFNAVVSTCLQAPVLTKSNAISASVACAESGGTLMSASTAARSTYLKSVADYVWIGASRNPFGNGFNWLNGDPFVYTDWCPNEPSSDGNCAHINICGSKHSWNDISCSDTFAYVCEAPLPPISSSPTMKPSISSSPTMKPTNVWQSVGISDCTGKHIECLNISI
jgi:hypothetical protein